MHNIGTQLIYYCCEFSFWMHDKEKLQYYVFLFSSELVFINNLNLVIVGQVL